MTGRREQRGAVKVMAKHLPRRDHSVPVDSGGHWWCTCGLPAAHPVHDLPEVSDDVHQAEARRYGEAS